MAFSNTQNHSALGTSVVSGKHFVLSQDDRRRHLYVVGQTGTGKTTMLENLILQDIHCGRGVTLLDPHGDIAERVANAIPKSRTKHTIYFDPSDRNFPIGFNPLANVPPEKREMVASAVVASFKGLWIDSWGEWLEYLLKNAVMAMLYYPAPGLSLIALPRFLQEVQFREEVLAHCTDPVINRFWDKYFSNLEQREELNKVISTLNKAGKLDISPTLRNILGQRTSGFDFGRLMDSEEILIVNLSKGLLGEDNSNLLGSLLVSHIVHLAMQRAAIAEEDRTDHHLYIDEFQNFTTRKFESILSEARKYRLSLTVAHQYLDQININVLKAVLGNVGTLALFSVGANDADNLAREFHPLQPEILMDSARGHCWVRYRKDGAPKDPRAIQGFPPFDVLQEKHKSFERVKESSRRRYSKRREKVEAALNKWYASAD